MPIKTAISLAALALAATPALAWDKGPQGPAYENMADSRSVHVRYPGDVAYPFGTVHVRGNRKIPYVEKCFWSYRWGRGLKQTCYRYTLENTRPARR